MFTVNMAIMNIQETEDLRITHFFPVSYVGEGGGGPTIFDENICNPAFPSLA